jgi:hypothetical protein
MDLNTVPKKIQYMTLDSNFITGTNNACSVSFNSESNVYIDGVKDVVGLQLIEFYITQVGEDNAGNNTAVKVIDIVCPDIPLPGQILDPRHGTVFARVPVERSSQITLHDRDWINPAKSEYTGFFSPISMSKLHLELYELRGDNSYRRLRPDASWFMLLKIFTIDHEAPKPDKVAIAIDRLSDYISKMPTPQIVVPPEPKPKIPLYTILIPVISMICAFLYTRRSSAPDVQTKSIFMSRPTI